MAAKAPKKRTLDEAFSDAWLAPEEPAPPKADDAEENADSQKLPPWDPEAKRDARKQKGQEVLARTVFVGNVPTSTSSKRLTKLLTRFGPIKSVRFRSIPLKTEATKLSKHRRRVEVLSGEVDSGDSAKCKNAYVVFTSVESANRCCEESGGIVSMKHKPKKAADDEGEDDGGDDDVEGEGEGEGEGTHTVRLRVSPAGEKVKDHTKCVFVGNLPFDCSDQKLWDHFADGTEVKGVRIIRDRVTRVGKGFGYVMFEDSKSARAALVLDNSDLDGRKIRVRKAQHPDKVKPEKPRKPARADNADSQQRGQAVRGRGRGGGMGNRGGGFGGGMGNRGGGFGGGMGNRGGGFGGGMGNRGGGRGGRGGRGAGPRRGGGQYRPKQFNRPARRGRQ